MFLMGLVMIAIYAYVFFAPYAGLSKAVAAEDWKAGGAALGRIRQLVGTNLTLGFLTIAIAQHLQGAIDRESSHWRATRHGFEHDQTKRFIARRKHEHIGGGIDLGQLVTRQHPHPHHVRVTRLELLF